MLNVILRDLFSRQVTENMSNLTETCKHLAKNTALRKRQYLITCKSSKYFWLRLAVQYSCHISDLVIFLTMSLQVIFIQIQTLLLAMFPISRNSNALFYSIICEYALHCYASHLFIFSLFLSVSVTIICYYYYLQQEANGQTEAS